MVTESVKVQRAQASQDERFYLVVHVVFTDGLVAVRALGSIASIDREPQDPCAAVEPCPRGFRQSRNPVHGVHGIWSSSWRSSMQVCVTAA
jgi:hypothetical protein